MTFYMLCGSDINLIFRANNANTSLELHQRRGKNAYKVQKEYLIKKKDTEVKKNILYTFKIPSN